MGERDVEEVKASLARGPRSRGIDACRVLAAVLVIWIHATSAVEFHPSIRHTTLGYLGVPFFTAAAMLFAVRQSYGGATATTLVVARIRRILVPFAVWAAVYWLITDLVFGRLMNGVPLEFDWREAMKGFTWHLWFLPFVFAVGVGAVLVARASVRSVTLTAAFVLAALFGAGALLGVPAGSDLDIRRWPYELPVALVSLAMALALRRGWLQIPRRVWTAGVLWLGVISLAVYALLEGQPPARRAGQAAGVLMLIAALATPDRCVPMWLARLGSLGFSVYVVHVVILQVLLNLLERDGVLTPAEALAVFSATVVLSFAVSWAGKRTPLVRRVLP
ncbi:MAG: acyltransferase [Planctomycetota bacterium]